MKDVLTEAMDLEGLIELLAGIRTGAIRCLAVDSATPSAFAHELLNANPYAFLDDAPLEERRARAVSMRGMVPEKLLGEAGRLDPAAIAELREECWPDVRDEHELHDLLCSLIVVPVEIVGEERSTGRCSLSGLRPKAGPRWPNMPDGDTWWRRNGCSIFASCGQRRSSSGHFPAPRKQRNCL